MKREYFNADSAWLAHPVTEEAELTRVRYSASAPHMPNNFGDNSPLPLARSPGLIRRALESVLPVVVEEGDPDLDPDLARQFGVRSELVQILRTREDEPWALG